MVDRHLTYKLLDRASLMCPKGNETVLSNISGAGSVHKPLSPFSNSIELLNGELGNDMSLLCLIMAVLLLPAVGWNKC